MTAPGPVGPPPGHAASPGGPGATPGRLLYPTFRSLRRPSGMTPSPLTVLKRAVELYRRLGRGGVPHAVGGASGAGLPCD